MELTLDSPRASAVDAAVVVGQARRLTVSADTQTQGAEAYNAAKGQLNPILTDIRSQMTALEALQVFGNLSASDVSANSKPIVRGLAANAAKHQHGEYQALEASKKAIQALLGQIKLFQITPAAQCSFVQRIPQVIAEAKAALKAAATLADGPLKAEITTRVAGANPAAAASPTSWEERLNHWFPGYDPRNEVPDTLVLAESKDAVVSAADPEVVKVSADDQATLVARHRGGSIDVSAVEAFKSSALNAMRAKLSECSGAGVDEMTSALARELDTAIRCIDPLTDPTAIAAARDQFADLFKRLNMHVGNEGEALSFVRPGALHLLERGHRRRSTGGGEGQELIPNVVDYRTLQLEEIHRLLEKKLPPISKDGPDPYQIHREKLLGWARQLPHVTRMYQVLGLDADIQAVKLLLGDEKDSDSGSGSGTDSGSPSPGASPSSRRLVDHKKRWSASALQGYLERDLDDPELRRDEAVRRIKEQITELTAIAGALRQATSARDSLDLILDANRHDALIHQMGNSAKNSAFLELVNKQLENLAKYVEEGKSLLKFRNREEDFEKILKKGRDLLAYMVSQTAGNVHE